MIFKIQIFSTIIALLFSSCVSKDLYIYNLHGDKIDISNEIKNGKYKLIDSIEKIKFINTTAKLTKSEIEEVNNFVSNKDSLNEIDYSYSYFIDSEIVDVFVTKGKNKYFIRKLNDELIKPFDTDELLWSK